MTDNTVGFGQRIPVQTEAANFVGGAVLEITEGKKTDLVFHMQTHKVVYVLQGQVKVWVLKDGQMNSLVVDAGQSFYVRPGLMHQLEAATRAVVVEFVSDTTYAEKDTSIVVKGAPSVVSPAPVVQEAQGNNAPAASEEAPVLTETTVEVKTPKRTSRKKKVSKKTK